MTTSIRQQRNQGYWKDVFNVKEELRSYLLQSNQPGIMPTGYELTKAGFGALAHAISRYHDYSDLAERLGLRHESTRKPRGYWDNPANLEHEIRQYSKDLGTPNLMPTRDQLAEAGRHDLINAIAKNKYGGFHKVSVKLGLQLPHDAKPFGYWDELQNLKSELLAFIDSHGDLGVMPSTAAFKAAGRSDLAGALRRHGGTPAVARRLGLQLSKQQTQRDRDWSDPAVLISELRKLQDEHGLASGTMPRYTDFVAWNRADLYKAMRRHHGGAATVARRFGMTFWTSPTRKTIRRPDGFWLDLNNVAAGIAEVNKRTGRTGVMPTNREFDEAGFSDLSAAIRKHHGGGMAVAELLGLDVSKQQKHGPKGLQDFAVLEKDLRGFMAEHGMDEVVPTLKQLHTGDRSDIAKAITRHHGGIRAVAKRLNATHGYRKSDDGYWSDFSNLERGLIEFVEAAGTAGQMPSNQELRAAGRTDLTGAIRLHGGFPTVAARIGLESRRRPYFTARSVEDVERVVRAVQPLAESNLLSGSQVVIILRRAGMLMYRSPRIARLNAALVRGDHEEIENALTSLTVDRESVDLEIVDQTSDEHASPEEAELLITESESSSISPTPDAPLLAGAEPDTIKERGTIRGLSALGELRLPLDEVLALLSSKLLWDAFYRRLYNWYGNLNAADRIRTEDVAAAIFETYPEHLDNEFVAAASARFADEVRQAINFAASLSQLGWRGPRLRLHQADAARRMCDLMDGTNEASNFLLEADDPGMGKSAAFLAAVSAAGLHDVLIVAPKTVADDTWTGTNGEIRRCLPKARAVRGLKAALNTQSSDGLTISVVHYDELLEASGLHSLASRQFDCICLDEIHLAKQRASQEVTLRRSALEVLLASSRVAIGLTGTPLVNELAEPLSLLQLLSQHDPTFDHTRLSSRRVSDIADVFEVLLPHVVRRRKQDVLLHLPGTDVRLVPVPIPPDLEHEMRDVHSWPRSRAGEALVRLRKLSTEAKLPYLVDRALAARKLLVLTYLADDVSDRIAEYLAEFLPGRVGHINGLTQREARKSIINSFRDDDGLQVLVGTIGTIGVGLTLFDPESDEMAKDIVVADLPYTWAEFEQGIARLDREGQTNLVVVDVLQTASSLSLGDGAPLHTLDEQLWSLIDGKRQLSELAVDGRFEIEDAGERAQKALRRWLKQAREIGVEPVSFGQRPPTSDVQRWRGEVARLRAMSSAEADDYFADEERTREFLEHLNTSRASALSHQWLRGKLGLIMRPDLVVVDLGCGLNRLEVLPCTVIGVDRHEVPGVLRGKMEAPPLADHSADVLVYSLSLYGTASDLFSYFREASRILRPGGHMLIVEPASSFTSSGLDRFLEGLRGFGFELVSSPKDLRDADGTLLTALHLTKAGEIGETSAAMFERVSEKGSSGQPTEHQIGRGEVNPGLL